ncbi:MAG TPA: hypothetical protein VJ827_06490 [Rubrobacter sp.]|nr:hypothetical protein [Rubrobacter sp.]
MPFESFELDLEEDMSLSDEFGLPLTLLIVRAKVGLDHRTTRRLLDVLRTAEPATLPTPSELAVVLPNTGPDSARAVENRALEVLPDARVGLAVYQPGDAVLDLLGRARSAAEP